MTIKVRKIDKKSTMIKISKKAARQKKIAIALVLLLVVFAFSFLKHQGLVDPERIFVFLRAYPTLSPILFILLYIVMSVTLVPTLPLNLGAGFLWGIIPGTVYSIIGATAGALVSFFLARYLLGDFFNRKFNHTAWVWLREEIEESGWKAVAFTRINPIFSFGPLNYFFGITSISWITYTWSTALFLTPPGALIVSLGHSMGSFTLEGSAYKLMQNILIVSAVFTVLTFVKLILKKRVKKLRSN